MDQPSPQKSRGLLARLFISSDEHRLRSGWRLALHSLFLSVFTFLFGLPIAGILLALGLLQRGNGQTLRPILNLASFAGLTVATYVARRYLDRRSFRSLGLDVDRHTLPDLAIGFALPGLMMGGIFLFEWAMGWLQFEGWAWQASSPRQALFGLISGLVLFAMVGWQEELMSRGYQLQNLADGLNLPLGVFLSSALFGVLHLANPNATLMSVLGILGAGLFLAYGWLRTGNLWLPIGLHFGWNFFEGTIFGFPVSGLDFFGLIQHRVQGPELITGGAFGPEAGLVLFPALALGTALLWLYTRGRVGINSEDYKTRSAPQTVGEKSPIEAS